MSLDKSFPEDIIPNENNIQPESTYAEVLQEKMNEKLENAHNPKPLPENLEELSYEEQLKVLESMQLHDERIPLLNRNRFSKISSRVFFKAYCHCDSCIGEFLANLDKFPDLNIAYIRNYLVKSSLLRSVLKHASLLGKTRKELAVEILNKNPYSSPTWYFRELSEQERNDLIPLILTRPRGLIYILELQARFGNISPGIRMIDVVYRALEEGEYQLDIFSFPRDVFHPRVLTEEEQMEVATTIIEKTRPYNIQENWSQFKNRDFPKQSYSLLFKKLNEFGARDFISKHVKDFSPEDQMTFVLQHFDYLSYHNELIKLLRKLSPEVDRTAIIKKLFGDE